MYFVRTTIKFRIISNESETIAYEDNFPIKMLEEDVKEYAKKKYQNCNIKVSPGSLSTDDYEQNISYQTYYFEVEVTPQLTIKKNKSVPKPAKYNEDKIIDQLNCLDIKEVAKYAYNKPQNSENKVDYNSVKENLESNCRDYLKNYLINSKCMDKNSKADQTVLDKCVKHIVPQVDTIIRHLFHKNYESKKPTDELTESALLS
ncbi:hypothetical protein COEREDRAFT_89476 [Coemansia reversa NRRL 1564]|uniref:Uncharacterized protein n=1 Tax=Coemansia reversa (strain ATCC 12441 / NRRL 1564) TaxID=763665 RepID=A0A2G5B3I2_COERN|nr:hypothetical protein COEREDRAFT_89476 [Coemansia reversa NRRL 1564]|eukprot:PIA13580.1 hypothetical protein COEREDRAFT_89476 [Coemansia reversa NRRL 1564]